MRADDTQGRDPLNNKESMSAAAPAEAESAESAESDAEVKAADRRRPRDRRRGTLRALLHGSLSPRRRSARRNGEATFSSVDWHHPQWLAVAMVTLLLSLGDALLTMELLQRGAYEANPLMEPFVQGNPLTFAVVKIGLTAGGIVVLILLARARVFRRLPVSYILYGVLLAYLMLVGYEFWMLDDLPDASSIPI
jgi:Domain of unknown function (DUF5658)